jgi:Zn-dependent M28 family amino/carboxypeptidase
VAGADPGRLRADVEALAAIGPRPAWDEESVQATLRHLAGRLTALGFEVTEERFVTPLVRREVRLEEDGTMVVVTVVETHELVNLLATRRGSTRPWELIELGAHYDSVPGSPGADDNASGVAALLEVARLLEGVALERSLRLCFYAAEEDGLLGSRHHASAVASAPGERLLGAVVVDMVGYARHEPGSQGSPVRVPLLFDPPDTGDFVLVVGNLHSGGIGARWEDAADRYAPDLGYYSVNRLAAFVPDAHRSDHASYWDHGLRAVLLTDTAELRSDLYHRPGDTPDTLDYAFLAGVTCALAATALEWAGEVDVGAR